MHEKWRDTQGSFQAVAKDQLKLKDRILANLREKGILATDRENVEFYYQEFNLDPHCIPPERYIRFPGGATRFNIISRGLKIYLNPNLDMFRPDYQLVTVLEEAIHFYQLKHTGRTEVSDSDEVNAKDKILKIGDFLGLDDERREWIRKSKEDYKE